MKICRIAKQFICVNLGASPEKICVICGQKEQVERSEQNRLQNRPSGTYPLLQEGVALEVHPPLKIFHQALFTIHDFHIEGTRSAPFTKYKLYNLYEPVCRQAGFSKHSLSTYYST